MQMPGGHLPDTGWTVSALYDFPLENRSSSPVVSTKPMAEVFEYFVVYSFVTKIRLFLKHTL